MSASASLDRPVARYNTTAMVLHWLVASLILINVFVAYLAAANEKTPDGRRLLDNHKSIGLTILGLVLLRLLWRLARKPPPLPASYSTGERHLAHSAHWALYAVMLALPFTGYLHDSAWKDAASHPLYLYGLAYMPRIGFIESLDPALKETLHNVFGAVHIYLGYALYALFALHIVGVVKHQVFDGEPELERMLPGGYEPPTERT